MWLVILAGIGKEIFDSIGGGIVDIWDIVATIAGGFFVWLIIELL